MSVTSKGRSPGPSSITENRAPSTPPPAGNSPALQRPQQGATSDGSAEVTVERSARASATPAVKSPRDVVTQFYAAFEKGDTDTLEKLYAPNVVFKDAIFSYSDRAGTMKMWRQILSDPTTKIRFTLDSVNGNQVNGHWVADYKLGGRPVHNEITTTMTVENGAITRHTDDFSWSKWAPQALPLGHLATLPGLKQIVQAIMRAKIDG